MFTFYGLGHHQYINCFLSPPASILKGRIKIDYLIKRPWLLVRARTNRILAIRTVTCEQKFGYSYGHIPSITYAVQRTNIILQIIRTVMYIMVACFYVTEIQLQLELDPQVAYYIYIYIQSYESRLLQIFVYSVVRTVTYKQNFGYSYGHVRTNRL